MERAYDQAKYGEFSRRPYIDMVIPTLTDPSVAPPGKHVLSCFVQYAPYKLAGGTWDDQREAFGDAVVDTLAEYAPNIRDIILHRQVLTPLDLEREFGLTEGNIFQGELTLEQLFFLRPAPGWAQYTTPDPQPLDVRLGDASRRRNHGRPRTQRGPADPRTDEVAMNVSSTFCVRRSAFYVLRSTFAFYVLRSAFYVRVLFCGIALGTEGASLRLECNAVPAPMHGQLTRR